MNATEYRALYDDLGYSPMPLPPGGNKPSRRRWPELSTQELWQASPVDSNIGLRAGNGIAFLDCDEKNAAGTVGNVTRYLAGLGLLPDDYPFVQTASVIGRHVYISFSGTLPGHYRVLSPEYGAGEFRYGPGAYIVAPPSIVGESAYQLIAGDLRQLPRLTLADILPLLKNRDTTTDEPDAGSNAKNRTKMHIPRAALALLTGRSIPGRDYASASERESAIVLSLVNAGFDFDSVHWLFKKHAANLPSFSKHLDKSEPNALRWLHYTYDKAEQYASAHPDSRERQAAVAYRAWGEAAPWPGRTGKGDRAVYLAHVALAYQAGNLAYGASYRELAERAGVSTATPARATRRLIDAGLITRDTASTAVHSTRYRLIPPLTIGQTDTLPKNKNVRECLSLSISHDVFRWAGLGKSAAQVWELLQAEPLTVKELAQVSGRHEKTVGRALARMAGIVDAVTGEYLPMVEQDAAGKWHALPVDLDTIAVVLGVAGMGKRQKAKHQQERELHRRALERGRQCTS